MWYPTEPSLRPVGNRLLVWPLPPEETTVGGVLIPDQAQEEKRHARVYSIGRGCSDSFRGEVKPGDVVQFANFAGQVYRERQPTVTAEGADLGVREVAFLILLESDVLGVIEEIPF